MTGTERKTSDKKIQQDFLWTLGPEATHQITRCEYRTELDTIKVDKQIKLYNRCYLPKTKKSSLRRGFIGQSKQLRKYPKITVRNYMNWKEIAMFRNLAPKYSYQIFYNINHRQKITGQVTERKRFRYTETSRLNTTKYIRQKEQE